MQIQNLNQLDLKKVVRKVNLIVPAQNAKLGPPVGPILGQVKIKVKDFCTIFNENTSKFKNGLPLPVSVFVYKNETFNFFIKTPSTTFLLKNYLINNNKKYLTYLDIYKIALIKKLDLDHVGLISIFKNVVLNAKILKIKVSKN
jgi:large subunit ribosomal protein L11